MEREAVRAFVWVSRPHPDGACAGATVGVAAPRAADAARLIRTSGWHGIKPADALALDDDDDAAAGLLAAPGVVMWQDGNDPGGDWRRQ